MSIEIEEFHLVEHFQSKYSIQIEKVGFRMRVVACLQSTKYVNAAGPQGDIISQKILDFLRNLVLYSMLSIYFIENVNFL